MKKLLVLLLSACFFTACNNDKGKNAPGTTTREKDDYNDSATSRNTGDTKDKGNTGDDNKTADPETGNEPTTDYTTSAHWPAKDIDDFISSCVTSAIKGGMQRLSSQRYCECMQMKIEKLHPNVKDVESMTDADMESPMMKKMIKDCLTN